MDSTIMLILAWSLAITSGLMAGTYFTFSGFIMRAFDTLESRDAVAAMNAINTVILGSVFMPLFFASSLLALALAAAGLWHWGEPGSGAALLAGTIYALGMFATTAAANVPLNNALQVPDREPGTAWADYRQRWTRWNTVRTLASTATLVLCMLLVAGA